MKIASQYLSIIPYTAEYGFHWSFILIHSLTLKNVLCYKLLSENQEDHSENRYIHDVNTDESSPVSCFLHTYIFPPFNS